MEQIKIYPGSPKGPRPEDDPEHYSKWFVENQPEWIYEGGVKTFEDIGVKHKFVRMVKDETEKTEYKTMIGYFFQEDELYPLQRYEG